MTEQITPTQTDQQAQPQTENGVSKRVKPPISKQSEAFQPSVSLPSAPVIMPAEVEVLKPIEPAAPSEPITPSEPPEPVQPIEPDSSSLPEVITLPSPIAPVEPSAISEPEAHASTPVQIKEDQAEAIRTKHLETLFQVDTYQEAETLLTENPDLVPEARQIFGSIVPTQAQTELMDLAIRATADDESMTLKSALRLKRRGEVTLTEPEVDQLLEFANEQLTRSPGLALNTALLLTDDVLGLADERLAGLQKTVLLRLGKTLDLDVTALWHQVDEPVLIQPPVTEPKPEPRPQQAATPPPTPEPAPKPAPEQTYVHPPKQKRTTSPPPKGKPEHHHKRKRPPRWALATGFVFFMSFASCSVCAIAHIF